MADNPQRKFQILGAITAALGAFSLGNVIGWSAPASDILQKELHATKEDLSWVGSIMTIGAALSTLYMAVTLDRLGRKLSMLTLAVPLTVGWLLLAFSRHIIIIIIGRFITGFSAGAFCVAAPTYIGETADKGIRGTLSIFFQLLLVIGILASYILGETKSLLTFTLPLAIVPIIFFVLMLLFFPETPIMLSIKGKPEQAEKSLKFFRGKDFEIAGEMQEIQDSTQKNESKFLEKFKTRACIKAFIMVLVMHTVQQLSGINAVMFFAHSIFEMTGSSIQPGVSAIILGIVQVIFCALSAVLVEKSGRKILWIISLMVMAVCLAVIGIFFWLQTTDKETAKTIAWLPLVFICIYLAGFSLGCGPLPWAMIGEFLPNAVKAYVGPFIAFFNWMLAFLVTKLFVTLVDLLGAHIVFWIFAVVCIAGVIFVVLFVLETKGKTLEEIQTELGTPPS